MMATNEIFEKIYDDNYRRIYNYLYMMTLNHALSEDLVEDAFVKVYEKLDKYDVEKASYYTWISTIAKNTLIDYKRKNLKLVLVEDEIIQVFPDERLSVEDEYEQKWQIKNLKKELTLLPEIDRKIISMKFFLEMKNREIAEELGISESNVSTKTQRILEKLEKRIEK